MFFICAFHIEFLKVKKNLSREKKRVKEVKEELLVENKAKKDALKEVEKLMRELSNQITVLEHQPVPRPL